MELLKQLEKEFGEVEYHENKSVNGYTRCTFGIKNVDTLSTSEKSLDSLYEEWIDKNYNGYYTKIIDMINSSSFKGVDKEYIEVLFGMSENRIVGEVEMDVFENNARSVMCQYFERLIGKDIKKETNMHLFKVQIIWVAENSVDVQIYKYLLSPAKGIVPGTEKFIGEKIIDLKYIESLEHFWDQVFWDKVLWDQVL